MANYNKNLFVGTGGVAGINESHFIGAAYGMERMMGRADTPLRRILNYAQDHFCRHLPLVFVLTVIGARADGSLAVRGLFIGDDVECFERAAALSCEVNLRSLTSRSRKWSSISTPRSSIAPGWATRRSTHAHGHRDCGELIVLAPGVATFGEDREIDRMIRKYGYRTTPEIMRFVEQTDDLPQNLSAAAHLIHGSSEQRFTITYCPGKLSREEIESVGYQHADLETMLRRYDPQKLRDGWNVLPTVSVFITSATRRWGYGLPATTEGVNARESAREGRPKMRYRGRRLGSARANLRPTTSRRCSAKTAKLGPINKILSMIPGMSTMGDILGDVDAESEIRQLWALLTR